MTDTLARHEGRVVALTGAASGMGRCTALRMAAEGASVFGIDIDGDGLAEVTAEVTAAGGTMHTRVTDLAEPAECRAAVEAAVAQYGRLDVVGTFAAISSMKNVTEVTLEEWRHMFAVNVDGTFFTCQAALPAYSRARAASSPSPPTPPPWGRPTWLPTARPRAPSRRSPGPWPWSS